ncbi:MAG: linear amide C-N hydrolase [Muribaculaceae bacterium]|nr:linear amide C-N hydrolase [Muribaculaceae bacterium]
MKNIKTAIISFCAASSLALGALLTAEPADACTRVVYHGNDSLFIVGRSLDWKTPIPTNLYVYPKGMHKQGAKSPDGINWTSKYGAVYAVGYDGGVTEGMNEKGLVVNGLFCKGTVYNNETTEKYPPVSMAMFVAWMLDNCATTDEVMNLLQTTKFSIEGATFDGGTVSALHWGITDKSGKTAILEFDHGIIRFYNPENIWAMTNDPNWPQMEAILAYWDKIGGTHMLPGTVSSPDRCVRANFFAHHVEQTADENLGLSITRSIMNNVSVPYTYLIQGEPNVSSTQWRSFADIKNLNYYFDIVTNPGIYYIDLSECDLSKGAKVMKLDTSAKADFVGKANSHLKVSAPFTPMY